MQQSPFPAFSVSPSSARRLTTCARAHYWAVYGSWGGWDDALPPSGPRRSAYILKTGQSLPGLVGTLVHAFARTAFDAKRADIPFNAEAAANAVRVAFMQAIENTQLRKYVVDPKTYPVVLELFYDDDVAVASRVQRCAADLDDALEALQLNGHFLAVMEGRAVVARCEEREQVRLRWPDAIEGGPDDFAVWVVPDLVYRLVDDPTGWVIVDWKTGNVDAASVDQLGMYATWLGTVAGAESRHVAAVAVYLRHYVEKVGQGTPEARAEAVGNMQAAAVKARALVEDDDVETNQPKPMEAFEQLPEGSKACRYCAFRRLCGRG